MLIGLMQCQSGIDNGTRTHRLTWASLLEAVKRGPGPPLGFWFNVRQVKLISNNAENSEDNNKPGEGS